MSVELKQALLRVLPFLAVIVGLSIGIKRGKLSRAELFIQPPTSYARFIAWWLVFAIIILVSELVLHRFGLLTVSAWQGSVLPSVLKIIGMVLLAPIAEELIFRALLLHKLTKWGVNRHL